MRATPDHAMTDESTVVARRRSAQLVFFFTTAAVLLILLVLAGVSIGSSHVPAGSVVRVMLAHLMPAGWVNLEGISSGQEAIIWQLRAPRVVAAALVGSALAVAGAQMQGFFRNPLASPDIIGASSGGALGAVIALASGLAMGNILALPLLSFAGSLGALFVVYAISTRGGRTPVTTLLLVGVAMTALLGAASSFLITMTRVRWEVAQEILFWLMGGLDNRRWVHCLMLLPCVAVGLAVAQSYGRDLDLLAAGEETALALGVEIERTKRILLVNAAMLTGAAVAISGVIGFVGLIAPHLARLLTRPAHRILLPAAALTGAVFLLAADLLARTVIRPEEMRLGIVTAGCGAPFFLYILLRRRRTLEY